MTINFHYRNCQNSLPEVGWTSRSSLKECTYVIGIRICHMTECRGPESRWTLAHYCTLFHSESLNLCGDLSPDPPGVSMFITHVACMTCQVDVGVRLAPATRNLVLPQS